LKEGGHKGRPSVKWTAPGPSARHNLTAVSIPAILSLREVPTNPNVVIAPITAGGSIVIAVTALLLNYRGFADLRSEMNARFGGVERRLDVIEGDLKEFFKALNRHDIELTRLKDKAGIN
jgi:hypothetical protein